MEDRSARVVLAELLGEEPDLGPGAYVSYRAERVWRFEWPGGEGTAVGVCDTCRGVHVSDRETLDAVLRAVQEGAVDTAPCTCSCCAVSS